MEHKLHGMINEQGHCFDERDDISGKQFFKSFQVNLWSLVP